MLVTRSAEIAKRARIMRLHGMNRDAQDLEPEGVALLQAALTRLDS